MSIIRWDPFDDLASLRESMDKLLEDFFTRRPRGEAVKEVLKQLVHRLAQRREVVKRIPPDDAHGTRLLRTVRSNTHDTASFDPRSSIRSWISISTRTPARFSPISWVMRRIIRTRSRSRSEYSR